MKKIMIFGFSGGGKSTAANKLGQKLGIKPLHLDSVHWLPNWIENTRENEIKHVAEHMKGERWIIEGNYRGVLWKERIEACDTLVFIDVNRLVCLKNVIGRYFKYRGSTRPDMGYGCNEKLDLEFIKWVIYDGRRKRRKNIETAELARKMGKRVYVLKNRKQINEWLNSVEPDGINERNIVK